jgi:acetoin utilization deacetylase AcuC-like enzyme
MALTGYFTHSDCLRHDIGQGHPECPQRLSAIADYLRARRMMDVVEECAAPLVDWSAVARAHSPEHIAHVQAQHSRLIEQAEAGGAALVPLDADTAMCAHTLAAARRAAGAVVAATDAVIAGELGNAFCAVRPPGHHALRSGSMGFCVFGNVAIGALHAIEKHGLKRVAIVDFDVHHGNGTEDIIAQHAQAKKLLMVGFFQSPFYPYSGGIDTAANASNAPIAAYTRALDIRAVFERHCIARLKAFRPEMIFISAGFDAHRDDTLGQLALGEADYAWMTEQLMQIADAHSKGRIVSVLEGGYNLDALARSVDAHVRALCGL